MIPHKYAIIAGDLSIVRWIDFHIVLKSVRQIVSVAEVKVSRNVQFEEEVLVPK